MSNPSLVSGLSEASGVRFSWVEVSQESLKIENKSWKIGLLKSCDARRHEAAERKQCRDAWRRRGNHRTR